jgi:hypothetical protein
MEEGKQDLLEETLELEKENNQLLRKIWRVQRWRLIFNILKLLAIVGLAGGAYYLIQPYVEVLLENLNNIKEVVNFMPR